MLHQVERTVEPKLAPCWRDPLIREAPGDCFRRKADAARFKRWPVPACDQHVFKCSLVRWQFRARFEEALRPEREAAIADVVPVVEVRPRSADIIILQKGGVP